MDLTEEISLDIGQSRPSDHVEGETLHGWEGRGGDLATLYFKTGSWDGGQKKKWWWYQPVRPFVDQGKDGFRTEDTTACVYGTHRERQKLEESQGLHRSQNSTVGDWPSAEQ